MVHQHLKPLLYGLFLAFFCGQIQAQNDSIFIRNIYNEALLNGKAYEDLRSLCKDVGPRLSGSSEAKWPFAGWNKK